MGGPHQTQRGGLRPIHSGLPEGGGATLCPAKPHSVHLPGQAHPRDEGPGHPLAHLHAGGRARPEQRRGRHPPQARQAPHDGEG